MSRAQVEQAIPLNPVGDAEAEKIEQRGHQIDGSNLRRDPAAFELFMWSLEDERHGNRCVVDEETVGDLFVLSQAFPVISDKSNNSVFRKLVGVDPIQQLAHQAIQKRHLTVIEAPGNTFVSTPVGLRRIEGRMGVVEMDPGEEPILFDRLHPVDGFRHHFIAPALHAVQADVIDLRKNQTHRGSGRIPDPIPSGNREQRPPRKHPSSNLPLSESRPTLFDRAPDSIRRCPARRGTWVRSR